MEIRYNVTGTDRKALVKAVGEIIEVKPVYMGMPTASYRIDYFTVTKDGTLVFDDMADSEEIENILERLNERGFTAEEVEDEELSEEEETAPQNANVALTVAIPRDKVNIERLEALVRSKSDLIKKALGVDDLVIETDEDTVSFPWFDEAKGGNEVRAYTHFITALCDISREQKRINKTDREIENEKYAFRCFLLRLGFIGSEFKEERKILLKNLSGSSAFRSGKNG